jgi:hypothetical protein
MRYINFDNLMNESLSFMTIHTKVTFVTASVAYLMLDPTCFVLGMPLSTFILAHVLIKCHFEGFVALSRSYGIFLLKSDNLIFTYLLRLFFSWTVSYTVDFFFAAEAPSLI